jgi:hypothetical protein
MKDSPILRELLARSPDPVDALGSLMEMGSTARTFLRLLLFLLERFL